MDLSELRATLRRGMVIPAHPLALTADCRLNERHQRALTRYYLASGAGGLAVGVHTTQFEIHDPQKGLLKAVWELAAEEVQRFEESSHRRVCRIAGLIGSTAQARREACLARELGYHCGLLSLGALQQEPEGGLLEHIRLVGEILPIFGFYLQPAVGGRVLSHGFWRQLAEVEPVVAIKIAPFNRYQTLDVVRAVAEAGRDHDIALYTGNDDNILLDLVTPFRFNVNARPRTLHIVGGLLGQWAVWTNNAVQLWEQAQEIVHNKRDIPAAFLSRHVELTDANSALFDAAHNFAGCIPGIHEVLYRQGLMAGPWCLDPDLQLSPGQKEEIDRVLAAYPHLADDDFVRRHRSEWMAP